MVTQINLAQILGIALFLMATGCGRRSGSGMPATQLSSGDSYQCIVSSGSAYCWGENSSGHLGDGTSDERLVPTLVSGFEGNVTKIAAGDRPYATTLTCAIESGAAKCWGSNQYGQLGTGGSSSSGVPVQVSGLTVDVTDIAAGNLHGCAVVSGAAKCWGYGGHGRIGNGTVSSSFTPAQVTGLTANVTAVAAGSQHSCALANGAAYCWGSNQYGQLGDGTTTDRNVPVQVSGLSVGVTQLVAGTFHTCAVVDGAVKCWGLNNYGQLGVTSSNSNCNSSACEPTPMQVSALTAGVESVSAGFQFSCAVVNGGAKCWGQNGCRQLGAGSNADSSATPLDVQGLASGVTAISGRRKSACAIVNGAVKCWGSMSHGQLGNGSDFNPVDDNNPVCSSPLETTAPVDVQAI